MSEPLHIGVVGAGTAGAAAALLLAEQGHDVVVHEAVEDPRPVGAGILLQPSGLGVLTRLGLAATMLARGSRVERLRAETTRGRVVLDLDYRDLDPGAFGLGMHRGVLFQALFDSLRAHPKIGLRLGAAIESFQGERPTLMDDAGQRHGPYDLLVVADGARSKLRDGLKVRRRASAYPWGALWFIAEDPDASFHGELFQRLEGTAGMLGFLPSGLGPEGETPRVSMFWSVRADTIEPWRVQGLEPWKARILSMEPRAEPVLAQIEDIDQVLFAGYQDVILRPWHAGRVVVIGDAAHATSPQLGQGANLALLDALTLVEALAGAGSVETALATYSRIRRPQLEYYQLASRWLTPFFQSDLRPLGWLRDVFMGPSCHLPYVRKRMIRTMCGLERGVLLRRPMSLPRLPPALPRGSA